MKKHLESLTPSEFFLSLLIIAVLGILFNYWDAKKRKDLEKQEKKMEIDRLLEYETDDREVEYRK